MSKEGISWLFDPEVGLGKKIFRIGLLGVVGTLIGGLVGFGFKAGSKIPR